MSEVKNFCSHSIIIKGLCCNCGEFLKTDHIGHSAILHNNTDCLVSSELALKLANSDNERLLKNRKLCLIVDLDQTLIHSFGLRLNETKRSYADSFKRAIDKVKNRSRGCDFLYTASNSAVFFTMFRRNYLTFLKSISNLFELHVFTMGMRKYVEPIIHHIDPDGALFGNRIKTRDECRIMNNKQIELSSIFSAGQDLVCILDDRVDVWNNSENVIQVMPFFHPVAVLSKTRKLPSFQNDIDEIEKIILNDYQKLLEFVHKIFYTPNSTYKSICNILKYVRSRILTGTCIYVSEYLFGYCVNYKNLVLLRLNEMGALLVDDPNDNQITHILADYLPVDKSISTKSIISTLNSVWVDFCYFRWKKVPEDDFLVSKGKIQTHYELAKLFSNSDSTNSVMDKLNNLDMKEISFDSDIGTERDYREKDVDVGIKFEEQFKTANEGIRMLKVIGMNSKNNHDEYCDIQHENSTTYDNLSKSWSMENEIDADFQINGYEELNEIDNQTKFSVSEPLENFNESLNVDFYQLSKEDKVGILESFNDFTSMNDVHHLSVKVSLETSTCNYVNRVNHCDEIPSRKRSIEACKDNEYLSNDDEELMDLARNLEDMFE